MKEMVFNLIDFIKVDLQSGEQNQSDNSK